MIQRLELKNWRSHKDSEFDFSKGVNVLVGIMGSGKSSVMDSLSFALFGTYPSLRQKKLKVDDIIRNKPEQCREARVALEFVHKDKKYEVERIIELGKGTTTANLRKDGILLEGPSPQRVNSYIEDILKIDSETFSRAIYSEQNQIDYFLNIPKGKRMAKIDQMLGIDKYESARKNATTLMNKIEAEATTKEDLIKDMLVEEDEKELANLKKESSEKRKELEKLSNEIIGLEAKYKTVRDKYNDLRDKEKLSGEIEAKNEKINGMLSEINSSLKEFGREIKEHTPETLNQKLENLDSEISSISKDILLVQEKTEDIKSKKGTLDALNSQKEKLEQILEENNFLKLSEEDIEQKGVALIEKTEEEIALDEKIKSILGEKKYGDLENDLSKTEKTHKETELSLTELSTKKDSILHIEKDLTHSSKCTVCKTELSPEKKAEVLEAHKAKALEIDEKIGELTQKKSELELKISEIKETLDSIADLKKEQESHAERKKYLLGDLIQKRNELNMLEDNTAKISQETRDIEASLEGKDSGELAKKKEELQKELQHTGELKKVLEASEKKKSLEEEFSKNEKELKNIGFKKEDLEKCNEELQKVSIEKEKKLSLKGGIHELIGEKEKQILKIEEKKELAKKYQEECKLLRGAKTQLTFFQNALLKTQETLRTEFVSIVNQVMNDVWETLYPYGDLSSIKLEVEDRDYILKAKTSVGWINVEGIASGGERTLSCLALRIAFSIALAPNLNWLILDEPTHNLDVNTIKKLTFTLRENLPKIIDQIFVITHEELLEDSVSGYLYKLERRKEIDEPTKLTLLVGPEVGI